MFTLGFEEELLANRIGKRIPEYQFCSQSYRLLFNNTVSKQCNIPDLAQSLPVFSSDRHFPGFLFVCFTFFLFIKKS